MKKTQKQTASSKKVTLAQAKDSLRPTVKAAMEDSKLPITLQIEKFFKNLRPEAKIAIQLFWAIDDARMELTASRPLDRLVGFISDCVNDVKTTDPELNQMLGLANFMELTRDKNSITIVG
jgi:hypothetical protein